MAKIMIDPPSGWMYGFPLAYDEEVDGDLMKWIVDHGYPQKAIDDFGDSFYVRRWTVQ